MEDAETNAEFRAEFTNGEAFRSQPDPMTLLTPAGTEDSQGDSPAIGSTDKKSFSTPSYLPDSSPTEPEFSLASGFNLQRKIEASNTGYGEFARRAQETKSEIDRILGETLATPGIIEDLGEQVIDGLVAHGHLAETQRPRVLGDLFNVLADIRDNLLNSLTQNTDYKTQIIKGRNETLEEAKVRREAGEPYNPNKLPTEPTPPHQTAPVD